jgi:hypothetical protein
VLHVLQQGLPKDRRNKYIDWERYEEQEAKHTKEGKLQVAATSGGRCL